MYNTTERSQTLAQEQHNALSMKSEIDYLNIKALQIGPMTILCRKCHAKKMDFAVLTVKLFYNNLRIFQN